MKETRKEELVNKYFPDGCCVCGGGVEIHPDKNIYRCNKCACFVSFQKPVKGLLVEAYRPLGYLADAETNELRLNVKNKFSKLWIPDKKRINRVFRTFVVELEDRYFGFIKSNTIMEYTKDGKSIKSKRNIVKNVNYRGKVYVYIAIILGINPHDFVENGGIGSLTYDQLELLFDLLNNLKD